MKKLIKPDIQNSSAIYLYESGWGTYGAMHQYACWDYNMERCPEWEVACDPGGWLCTAQYCLC